MLLLPDEPPKLFKKPVAPPHNEKRGSEPFFAVSHPLHRQETRATLTAMAKAGVNFEYSPHWKRARPSTAPRTRPTLKAEPKHAALAAPSQAP